MTLNQFLKVISKTRAGWRYCSNGCIRSKTGCCPLSYLANIKLKRRRFSTQYRVPARILKIKEKDCDTIVDAADGYDNDFRPKLLKACGLPNT